MELKIQPHPCESKAARMGCSPGAGNLYEREISVRLESEKRPRMRLLGICLFLLFPSAGIPSTLPIRTDVVQKSIVFLYYQRVVGNQRLEEQATGFLLQVPVKDNPNQAHQMIVTV